ncbi:SDR family oxidoreductase [Clostridium sp. SHJSY1]|uniref:SDR family oxidoreductase n=1 Tax=Clostridium sp. SHJSY1 TaxID=2942483 RepID=UPI002875E649|nr:SDR family oxidoreductase [Clostridium sp. SHJSY1]MDS0524445.1 SDR family oxidoreductase [Clostridium sp. SHJSY1]
MIENTFPKVFPPQTQNTQPGIENQMSPLPIYEHEEYNFNANRLKDKVAIITGGDSGIGRAVAIAYAKEGAKVAIIYLNEDKDAEETKRKIDGYGGISLLIKGDIGDEIFCQNAVNTVINSFSKIDILICNSAEQHTANSIEDITYEQLDRTFRTNVYGTIFMVKNSIKHLKEGASIIITTSITAYQGNETLIDYSSTKGALVSLTRSLSKSLAPKKIRVNAVAPGPVWTPLIPSSMPSEDVQKFGSKTEFKRAAQPVELAEAYVFLASQGASFITGEAIHVNGGEFVNS